MIAARRISARRAGARGTRGSERGGRRARAASAGDGRAPQHDEDEQRSAGRARQRGARRAARAAPSALGRRPTPTVPRARARRGPAGPRRPRTRRRAGRAPPVLPTRTRPWPASCADPSTVSSGRSSTISFCSPAAAELALSTRASARGARAGARIGLDAGQRLRRADVRQRDAGVQQPGHEPRERTPASSSAESQATSTVGRIDRDRKPARDDAPSPATGEPITRDRTRRAHPRARQLRGAIRRRCALASRTSTARARRPAAGRVGARPATVIPRERRTRHPLDAQHEYRA